MRVLEPAKMPDDDAFAHRLWDTNFGRQVRKACRPIMPQVLRPDWDDIIQDALAKAYEKRSQFKGESQEDLLGWVLVIIRNLSRDKLDAREARPEEEPLPEGAPDPKPRSVQGVPVLPPAGEVEVEPMSDELADAKPGPVEAAEETELPARMCQQHDMMKGILGLLSKEDREVLLLRIGQGLSVARTAEFLGIREGAVKMRTRRALERLKEMASRVGLRPESLSPPKDKTGEDEEE